jgi:glycosyltransferase involved in cell wall biosynthesis
MRILYINTTDLAGGAAVVMQRLIRGLHQQYCTEHLLLVKDKRGDADTTKAVLTSKFEIYSEKIIDRISRKIGLLYQSFPFSSRRILAAAKAFRPDVINLHNTHGAYFATPLLEPLSKMAPIVWTLHDMWSFSANASHTFGNMSWKELKNDASLTKIPPSIGINTGAWLLRQKKKIYGQSALSIVTPSKWLYDLAKQSPVFEGKTVHHVYNGIDPQVFFPADKKAIKQKLNLDPDSPVIIFISHFLTRNNPWKGGNDLLEILARINRQTTKKITLLMLGEGTHQDLAGLTNLNIVYTGYLRGEEAVRDRLQAADLFIYPTRADNLPNVLVESIACGTPGITFNIGGNAEIIKHNYNGIIIPPFDFDAFAAEVIALLNDGNRRALLSANCATHVQENFLQSTMIREYYRIFEEAIRDKNG